MDRASEVSGQKENISATDSVFSDLRQTTISHRDNRPDSAAQKEWAYRTQKPITVVNNGIASIASSPSEGSTPAALANNTVFIQSPPAGTTAADRDDQKIWNAAPNHHQEKTNRDEFPLDAEMTPVLSGSSNRVTAANGPGGINTQAVIDQIRMQSSP